MAEMDALPSLVGLNLHIDPWWAVEFLESLQPLGEETRLGGRGLDGNNLGRWGRRELNTRVDIVGPWRRRWRLVILVDDAPVLEQLQSGAVLVKSAARHAARSHQAVSARSSPVGMCSGEETIAAHVACVQVVADVGEDTLPAPVVALVVIPIAQLVGEGISICVCSSISHGESDAVGHAHGAHARCIVILGLVLDLALDSILGTGLCSLIRSHLVEDRLESSFRDMDLALILALLFLPLVLLLGPLAMDTLGVLFLTAHLLLHRFESLLGVGSRLNGIISLPRQLAQCRGCSTFQERELAFERPTLLARGHESFLQSFRFTPGVVQ